MMRKILFYAIVAGCLWITYHPANAQQTTLEKILTDDLMGNEEVAPNDYAGTFSKTYMVNTVNAMIGSFGDAEMVIMKTDTGGNLLDHKIWGKPMYHDICTEVTFKDDQFYFAGYTRGIDTSASPLFTSFIIKTDEQLNILSQKNYILPNSDFFLETFTSGNGNYILSSGKFYDFNTTNWYLYIMKTDTAGNVLWITDPFLTPFLAADVKKINELPNGDILLMGSITIGFEQSLSTMMLFDGLGEFKWGKVYNYDLVPTQNSTLQFGKLLSNGQLMACGRTDYPGIGNLGQMDYQIMRIDTSDGNLIWSKTFGGNQIDWLYGASYDQTSGKFILLGNSGSFFNNSAFYGCHTRVDTSGVATYSFLQGDTSDHYYNLFFANYSRLSGGDIMIGGNRVIGNSKFNLTRHSALTASLGGCNYYPVSLASLSAPYPTFSYTINPTTPINLQTNSLQLDESSGITDSLLCYTTSPAVGMQTAKENVSIDIFPNPSDDFLNVNIQNELIASDPYILFIYDISGNVVGKHILEQNENLISHQLASGIYVIKIEGNQSVKTMKLIVNK